MWVMTNLQYLEVLPEKNMVFTRPGKGLFLLPQWWHWLELIFTYFLMTLSFLLGYSQLKFRSYSFSILSQPQMTEESLKVCTVTSFMC